MSDIHRVGKVTSIDPANRTARVRFEELDNVVSHNLKLMSLGTDWLPVVGDVVLCAFLETGMETGFVLGKI